MSHSILEVGLYDNYAIIRCGCGWTTSITYDWRPGDIYDQLFDKFHTHYK